MKTSEKILQDLPITQEALAELLEINRSTLAMSFHRGESLPVAVSELLLFLRKTVQQLPARTLHQVEGEQEESSKKEENAYRKKEQGRIQEQLYIKKAQFEKMKAAYQQAIKKQAFALATIGQLPEGTPNRQYKLDCLQFQVLKAKQWLNKNPKWKLLKVQQQIAALNAELKIVSS